MTQRHWKTVEVDAGAVERLAGELKLPRCVAAVLVGRGFGDGETAQRFMTPRLSLLSDPFDLPDMRPAVDRIWRAVERGETIAVFGDYDADGVTSTALLVRVLRELGARVLSFLPNRLEDGYGLTESALRKCREALRPDLIVTVDCGTGAAASVAAARRDGVDVVVTDHHEVPATMAPALAVVNPKRSPEPATEQLAGVGVAFKLCHGLVKHGLKAGKPAVAEIDLRRYLDLVAIGTVADVAPLLGENRILVRHGLTRLACTDWIGLRSMLRVLKIEKEPDCYHLGFLVGPRLNAAGRLGDADDALELLLTEDARRADTLVRALDRANSMRRQIEASIVAEADEALAFLPDRDFGLVVGGDGWHIGTVGIAASRLSGRYYRPAFVIGFDESGFGRGSGRSIEEVDLIQVLAGCGDLLDSYGGHKLAAGLVIARDKLPAFRERFNRLCAEACRHCAPLPVETVDAWVDSLGEVDWNLFEALRGLAPLGVGNPTPVFGVRGVQLAGPPRVVGEHHLKMALASGAAQLDAIAFRMADRALPDGPLDVLFSVRENTYMGRTSLQLHVADFRASAWCPVRQ